MTKNMPWLMCGVMMWAAGMLEAAVVPASLFSHHAVLQRDVPVPVWGTATPGETVVVSFAGQTKETVADGAGRWLVRLDPLSASAEPRVLRIGTNEFENVLVGEVWLCSGQSNMQWLLPNTTGSASAIAGAADDHLRIFTVPRREADVPQADVNAKWNVSSPRAARNFSAVAYYFGRELREALGVPVGLVVSAVGGTPARAWTPMRVMERDPVLQTILEQHEEAVRAYSPEAAQADHARAMEEWSKKAAEAKAARRKAPPAPILNEGPRKSNQRPACLYNGMIHPLKPYAVRGVIWYQGESDWRRPEEYVNLLPAMIDSWREDFEAPGLPFLQTELAPFEELTPLIREAQARIARTHPGTYLAGTADLGEKRDIHPPRKAEVGQRLARIARARVYGESIAYSGPVFSGMTVTNGKAILRFEHAEGGLVARDGRLTNFTGTAVGQTNVVPLQAVIEGTTVVVSSDTIKEIGAVRYGWSGWYHGDLFNAAGLPAFSFRTDAPATR